MQLIATNKEERLDACRQCPFYNAERNKCEQCGCNMTIKALYANSVCPLKLWGCVDCEVK